ncbi:MAG TPA: hypothetical protein VGI39_45785 [Polyangiaceae bacterium]|jgi:hypothetical protein
MNRIQISLALRSAVSAVLFGALAAGCSSAAGEEGTSAGERASSSSQALHHAAGQSCSASAACGTGYYCAPSATSPACGTGTCMASPQNCPSFETVGVCGCDGKAYKNSSCAMMEGTTSEGDRAIAGAAIADVAGKWGRVVSQDATNHVEYDETLIVKDDGTYSLFQSDRCFPTPGYVCSKQIRIDAESTGTVVAGTNGGFLFQGVTCTLGNCSGLATEFRFEHNCTAYDGPLHVSVIEPPGASETFTYYLEQE